MLQALLIAVLATIIAMEEFVGGQMLSRPIIVGPVIGLVMGDIVTGIIIGGTLELVWMGVAAIGATTPPDVIIGSALATVFCIKTDIGPEAALAIAIPASMLGQICFVGAVAYNSVLCHKADNYAEQGNYRGVERCNWLGLLTLMVPKFLLIFLGCMVDSAVIQKVVDMIPMFIQNGLAQSCNLLPALGIAMLIQMTFNKKFAAFLFLGFALVVFFNASTIAVAVIGLLCAYIFYQFSGDKEISVVPDNESEEL